MTWKSSPTKTPRKPILRIPIRPTPKALTTPKSVTRRSDPMDDIPAPTQNPTLLETPVLVHGGAKPKTHGADETPLLPSITFSSPTTAIGAEKNSFFYTFRREWGGCG